MSTRVITVSDTLDVHSFSVDAQMAFGSESFPSSVRDDAIRARLADIDRQEEKRRHLSAFLERGSPAWNPDDHPDIDQAGGAAAWVRTLRNEAEQGFDKRTRNHGQE